MDARFSPNTSQKADVRPISFVLDNFGSLSAPVTLPIRPEDLTRSEPTRAAVHQTLGREVMGWVDNFGEGLPQVTITGHTGWGYKPATGKDGFESFEELNSLVAHQYTKSLQDAIDSGRDPQQVKLLFVDLLDNFAYQVVPMQFNLRRSKSSPLLFRYNIVMQAVNTSVDGGLARFLPNFGSPTAGVNSLLSAIDRMESMIGGVQSSINSFLRPIASNVMAFVRFSITFLRKVQRLANSTAGLFTNTAGQVITIAKGIAQVGREVFRTFSAIQGISMAAKMAFMRMGAAFNEVVCVFSNSLRPRTIYEDYEGLYGASNCSSTTGGRLPSAYADTNVFLSIGQSSKAPVSLSGSALNGINTITKGDVVDSPLPQSEIGRHLGNITAGVAVSI